MTPCAAAGISPRRPGTLAPTAPNRSQPLPTAPNRRKLPVNDARTHQSRWPATPLTYTHVIAATGSRLVFISDQVAEDSKGNLVGPGDLAAQARQAFANVGRALAAARARPDQVTKITIFVAGYRREHLPAIEEGRMALFGDHKPADTLVGVAALSRPDYLIEVDPSNSDRPQHQRETQVGDPAEAAVG